MNWIKSHKYLISFWIGYLFILFGFFLAVPSWEFLKYPPTYILIGIAIIFTTFAIWFDKPMDRGIDRMDNHDDYY